MRRSAVRLSVRTGLRDNWFGVEFGDASRLGHRGSSSKGFAGNPWLDWRLSAWFSSPRARVSGQKCPRVHIRSILELDPRLALANLADYEGGHTIVGELTDQAIDEIGTDDGDEADAHVEDAVHFVVRHAA